MAGATPRAKSAPSVSTTLASAAPTKAGTATPEPDRVLVTQTRSSIGTKPKTKGTLRALGLRGIGQSNVLPDRPEIRGMLARVPHLVSIVPAPAGHLAAASKEKTRS